MRVKIAGYVILIICTFSIIISCSSLSKQEIEDIVFTSPCLPVHLNLPDPGLDGEYTVASFYYASPYNPRRYEYRLENLKAVTEPVNLSPYTNSVDKDHWGFDSKSCPVNGKLFYPDSAGEFPLVLCVHGNHDPYDESEFGYEYLGRFLASRGMIFGTVDENFLNGVEDGQENDARAIMLLEHIRQILTWNRDAENPLFGKIDENNIALIGHSRGGEAVVSASVFNRLQNYPDNANIKFNWDFSIKGVVSLAPIEGQYRVSEKPFSPKDVNYLLLHGSYDGDVDADFGLRFFNRGRPESGKFRSSFWIFGANHAQFNSSWAKKQDPRPTFRQNLLTAKEQMRITKCIISAFLEVSFERNPAYIDFLKDCRKGISWLPKTVYLSRYQDNSGQVLADFDDDVLTETATLKNWFINSSGFSLWKEGVLRYDIGIPFFISPDSPFLYHHFNQESWSLFLKWEKFTGAQAKPVLSLSGFSNPVPADSLVLDIAVLELDSDKKVLDFDIKIMTDTGKIFLAAFKDHYSLMEVPVSWIMSKGESKPMILQTVFIPLYKLDGWTDQIKITKIEFSFERMKRGFIILDNILLKHNNKQ